MKKMKRVKCKLSNQGNKNRRIEKSLEEYFSLREKEDDAEK